MIHHLSGPSLCEVSLRFLTACGVFKNILRDGNLRWSPADGNRGNLFIGKKLPKHHVFLVLMFQRRNSWPSVCAFGRWESFRLEQLYLEMNSARVRLQMIFNSKETRLLKRSRLLRPVRDTAICMNDRQKYTGLKVNGAVLWCLASSRLCQIHKRTENASEINSVKLNFWIEANHKQNWSLYTQMCFCWGNPTSSLFIFIYTSKLEKMHQGPNQMLQTNNVWKWPKTVTYKRRKSVYFAILTMLDTRLIWILFIFTFTYIYIFWHRPDQFFFFFFANKPKFSEIKFNN